MSVLRDPWFTKGTAFTHAERERLALRGLLPPVPTSLDVQKDRIMEEWATGFKDRREAESREKRELARSGVTPEMIRRHRLLQDLHDRNETLYYHLLQENFRDMAPIVYTPTVGWACQHFAHTYRNARGMYFSANDKGDMHSMVYNWPNEHVDAVVVTDGSRILGLGDLGAGGMGISIGKLDCYVASAGFDPRRVLPVCLDVGTNNEYLLKDPLYLGLRQKRITGDAYVELVDEMMAAILNRYPRALVQFEDFTANHANLLLERYRNHHLVFNDDIQGTGCSALAGVLTSLAAQGLRKCAIKRMRFLVAGAGGSALGVVDSIRQAMVRHGLSDEEARRNFWICDHHGLITTARDPSTMHNETAMKYARPETKYEKADLVTAAEAARPTALLGFSTAHGIFTNRLLKRVQHYASHEQLRPLILPMSNPTSNAECTHAEAVFATNGRAIVATGSPFPDADHDGILYPNNQANNIYTFPGIALGAVAGQCERVSDGMVMAAAEALSKHTMDVYGDANRMICLNPNDQKPIRLFPPLEGARNAAVDVAVGVVVQAAEEGLVRRHRTGALEVLENKGETSLRGYIERWMWSAKYASISFSAATVRS